jgi:hypothetical protein
MHEVVAAALNSCVRSGSTRLASLHRRVQLDDLEHTEEDTVRNLVVATLIALVGIGAPAIAQENVKKSKSKTSSDSIKAELAGLARYGKGPSNLFVRAACDTNSKSWRRTCATTRG